MLKKDKEEVEAIKHAKALEAEKAMYSVRCNYLLLYLKKIQISNIFVIVSGPSLSETEERV